MAKLGLGVDISESVSSGLGSMFASGDSCRRIWDLIRDWSSAWQAVESQRLLIRAEIDGRFHFENFY